MDWKYRIVETVNPMGMYIYPQEFRWIINSFRDYYDPMKLCYCIQINTGLRVSNAINISISDFRNNFTEINVPEVKSHTKFMNTRCKECKGKGNIDKLEKYGVCFACSGTGKDTKITTEVKWRWSPLSDWLARDIRNYVKYRATMGHSVGVDISNNRLFPTLKMKNIEAWWTKIRKRHSGKQPWLKDPWKIYRYFDKDKKFVRQMVRYRVTNHATKAFYCTGAYDICDRDLIATKSLSQHTDVKTLQIYTKSFNIMEKKRELKDKFIEPLMTVQSTPILKGQRKLLNYF